MELHHYASLELKSSSHHLSCKNILVIFTTDANCPNIIPITVGTVCYLGYKIITTTETEHRETFKTVAAKSLSILHFRPKPNPLKVT